MVALAPTPSVVTVQPLLASYRVDRRSVVGSNGLEEGLELLVAGGFGLDFDLEIPLGYVVHRAVRVPRMVYSWTSGPFVAQATSSEMETPE